MASGAEQDLSEFLRHSNPHKVHCRVKRAAEQLPETEREQLAAALATDRLHITNAAISVWLRARGHDVSHQFVTSHRRGHCTCADE